MRIKTDYPLILAQLKAVTESERIPGIKQERLIVKICSLLENLASTSVVKAGKTDKTRGLWLYVKRYNEIFFNCYCIYRNIRSFHIFNKSNY